MTDQPPILSIIMISYNTRQMTLDCLASVYAETTLPFELIVVDNASSDGSAKAIAQAFPDVHLIAEDTNHGFAPAHDIALPHASAPWLLLLNPDTVVQNHALDALYDFAQTHPEAGIWGGRTVFADGSLNPSSCWGQMTLWSTLCRILGLNRIFRSSEFFNPETYGSWDRTNIREVDIVVGCLFLMRRADWDRLGGFDPTFVMYGEEADLCLRAKQQGYRPMVTPAAQIIHYAGASETVRTDKMVRLMKAKTELIKRHFRPGTRHLGRALFALWPLSRWIATGIGGAALGRASLKEKAQNWRQIWARRNEWKDGFSP